LSPSGHRRSGLSKSRFLLGLQCHKRLWWAVHEPGAPELQPGPLLQGIFDRGHRVGELAQRHVPGGVLVEAPHGNVASRLTQTRAALDAGAAVIYEASFSVAGVFVAVDILERHNGAWNLIEVKSASRVKEPNAWDIALQAHVLEAAGLLLARRELMHMNRACAYPHLDDLFTRTDLTDRTRELQAGVPERLAAMRAALIGPLPEVEVGDHCSSPYACPFAGRCWPEPPEHPLGELYNARRKQLDALAARGIERIADLPDDEPLNAIAARQRQAVISNEMIVEPGLGAVLGALRPPLLFLDFEAVMPAIPCWDGCHPFDAVPVQFSCHRLDETGRVSHQAWLADGPDDPRVPLAEALLAACSGDIPVVAYHASFERRMILGLAARLPAYAVALEALAGRLHDLLPIVRDHVYVPAFHGRFSLKSVLPALVEDLGYDDLEIAGGDLASIELERLLFADDAFEPAEHAALRDRLLAYCERDTLALVHLYRRLGELVAGDWR